jgi:hypothetical protein
VVVDWFIGSGSGRDVRTITGDVYAKDVTIYCCGLDSAFLGKLPSSIQVYEMEGIEIYEMEGEKTTGVLCAGKIVDANSAVPERLR